MANIEHLQKINTSIDLIYQALTTEEGLANVWTNSLSVTNEVNGFSSFYFGGEDRVKVRIIELKPDELVSWECVASDEEPEWIGTTITFELYKQENHAVVELTHAGWQEVSSCYRYCNYNWSMFLQSLKHYCEEGKGAPYQA
ncbi:Uncharacterized conserved protein YndB, AHSA1/START domain [Amphibacillus marinus]|uniref:Uncharacterized conserved protein YndB, AHSA1/START domain n=1 Tax=Amphibacillus marinus TaxID=872970 RepID=A0A1H8KB83_9BACI|nr:SRPBCC domain-containing protein [Amphibacillus marinus]SEN90269.1 Uncharacterized conserved protein YndB, AHSA1/START domain [Amphibacillus marinus]